MRANTLIITTAGEIPVQDRYSDTLRKYRYALDTLEPVILALYAAGGDDNYLEEKGITIVVDEIVGFRDVSE